MYDVIIIGAGPIGSYLAQKLASNKHKVLVLEKGKSAYDNVCCTGILSSDCYHKLSLDSSILLQKANSAVFYAPSGRSMKIQRDNEVAYITDRPLINQTLANKAEISGSQYMYNTRAINIHKCPDMLIINTKNPNGDIQFYARSAVIAAGFGTELTKKLGFNVINKFNIGIQAEVELTDHTEVEIYADNITFPGGFGWLVPTKESKAFAGIIGQLDYRPQYHLSKFLDKLKQRNKIISNEVVQKIAAIPLQPLAKTYCDRILFVGEAAGQVKPITGGGVYFGIICAEIAGNVLHQALSTNNLLQQNLKEYQKLWHARLGSEIALSYLTQRIWSKCSNKHIEYLFNICQKKNIPELISTAKDFSFDWHSKILIQIALSFLSFTGKQKKL